MVVFLFVFLVKKERKIAITYCKRAIMECIYSNDLTFCKRVFKTSVHYPNHPPKWKGTNKFIQINSPKEKDTYRTNKICIKGTSRSEGMKPAVVIMVLLLILSGCSNSMMPSEVVIENPTPKEMLAENPDADIFVMDGYVFSNAGHVEWVRQQEYELGEQVGEITRQTSYSWRFKEGTASKLPVGTKIFDTNAPFYIAVVDGQEIAYIKLLEG